MKAKKAAATKKLANVPADKMAHAVAAFLEKQGWDAHVVGPCEVRNTVGFHDQSGKELRQYEFVARFYGRKTPVKCADRE